MSTSSKFPKSTPAYLSPKVKEMLRNHAFHTRQAQSEIMEQALIEYFERVKRK
jgi:predicted transcriptional regulator